MSDIVEPRTDEGTLIATTTDGAKLSITRLRRDGAGAPPVVLTHGTFSNGKLCAKLARYLHGEGFDCWILDWRGHGRSEASAEAPDYERIGRYEPECALRAVQEATGSESIFWVGHSAGGVLPFMYLARNPEARRCFRGIVAMASQTTHAGRKLSGKLALGVGYALTNILGKAPAKLFRLGPDDEPRPLMNQWFRWNLTGRWVGSDGFDYLSRLADVTCPVLYLAGGGDTFIAPVEGCRQIFDALGSEDKKLVHCKKTEGFREDYSHAGLIASSAAREEIWPAIARWLKDRSAAAA